MKSSVKTSLIVVGLLLITVGCFLVLDGMLPTRSAGKNPSLLEIIAGLGLVIFGWLARRSGKMGLKS